MSEPLVIAAYVVTYGAIFGIRGVAASPLAGGRLRKRLSVNHRRFVLLGAVGVVALVAILAVSSLSSGLTYYLYPSEAVEQRADFPDGTRFRLAGMVESGSVTEAGRIVSFTVVDGAASVDVDLDGRVPPLFGEGVPVLVEGTWSGDRFAADEAVIRHDENYEVPHEGGGFSHERARRPLMLAFLGLGGIAVAMAGSIWLVVGGALNAADLRRSDPEVSQTSRSLQPAAAMVLGGAITAFAVLVLALLFDDFSLAYVAGNHSRATPFPFNVATAWAALEGSIVLWGVVLATFTWLVFRDHRARQDALSAGALAVMGAVGVFFFGLMLTVADPFRICIEATGNQCLASSPWPWQAISAPADGPGPNPLLQNHILMAVHPPLLYIGYVGLTTPFAYAISALALGQPGPEWLQRTRRWTLVAWSFLTLGILMGGWWAYEVLSWGGYWAWDPVENASLMPWLVATAFIHSSLVQQRRGMLQAWNFVLVISAFALTILGTFLTRSGTIQSVHSFTQSAIGPVLLGFLVLVLGGSFALFATRSHLVSSAPRLDSFASREGTFLANNLLLTVFALVVLVGTVYPLVLEAFTGTRVGVGEPFYNSLTVPLSFGLLLLMGIGPVTPWRHGSGALVWARVRGPLQFALLVGIGSALLVSRIGWVVIAVVCSTFVMAVLVRHLHEMAARRTRATGRSLIHETGQVLRSDQGFWAGQLSHFGVAMVALGLAFTANLSTHTTVDLVPGESFSFGGYDLTYTAPFQRTDPGRRVVGATVVVAEDGTVVTELQPRANYFGDDQTGITTPAVMSGIRGDLYLTLLDIDSVGIRLQADTSPAIWMVWLGGLVTAAGGFWAIRARRAVVTAPAGRLEVTHG